MTFQRPTQIDPGALLGVLGGGQLGAMFAVAARRLGYRIAVWDPDVAAPAHGIADRSITRPFSDENGVAQFLDGLAAVTYEWENVPAALCERLAAVVPVRPGCQVLRTIQHRVEQKRFLTGCGLPVAAYADIRSAGDVDRVAAIGYPCILKTATTGYDGKGQWRVETPADLGSIKNMLPVHPIEGRSWIVESVVPFVRELSVLIALGCDGRSIVYPAVENVHERGILRMTSVPAPVTSEVSERAQRMSAAAVSALNSPGVYCVELFQSADGSLLINEIAPRPHNSGHYTLDACTVSQFEQQVRALCGLPLGEARLTTPATMINLLGEEAVRMSRAEHLAALLAEPGTHLHVYRKREIRPGRKMGHVTVTGETAETVRARAAMLLARLHQAVAS